MGTAEARALTDDDVEAWKRRYLQNDWAPARLPELECAWAMMDVPETMASYGRVVAGSDGSLWGGAADYPEDHTSLLVFDPEGSFAGSVEIPGRFVPHDSDPRWVLGVLRDERDAAYIHMYEVRAR
jgi:hypothetical protein